MMNVGVCVCCMLVYVHVACFCIGMLHIGVLVYCVLVYVSAAVIKNSVKIFLATAAHWSSSIYWGYRNDGTAAACRPKAKHAIEIAHAKVLCLGDYGGDCNFHSHRCFPVLFCFSIK